MENNITQKEYDVKLEKFNFLKEKLNKVSRDKIDSAYSDPGNTWHDNFAYEQFEQEENALLNQLEKLADDINDSKVIKKGQVGNNCVDIYDKVKLKFLYDDDFDIDVMTLGLADDNSITLNSPLGQVIYGSKVGQIVSYKVNNKPVKVEIVEIIY